MNRVFALIAAGAVLAVPALAAQDQPATGASGGEDLALDDDLDLLLNGNNQMGWTSIPGPLPEDENASLTELELLSRSPSGVTFGLEAYDAREDNPLTPVSVTLRALDKITATYQDLVIPIGEQGTFGPLTILPRTCDKRPPEETPETTAFLEVYAGESDVSGQRARNALVEGDEQVSIAPVSNPSIVLPGEEPAGDVEGEPLFTGWMFASSPSLNAMEHPVYDVWVIDCKMVDPEI
ncbi:MAG: DUF2155 domain-containing protein [Pseudomonadota bacterium]